MDKETIVSVKRWINKLYEEGSFSNTADFKHSIDLMLLGAAFGYEEAIKNIKETHIKLVEGKGE